MDFRTHKKQIMLRKYLLIIVIFSLFENIQIFSQSFIEAGLEKNLTSFKTNSNSKFSIIISNKSQDNLILLDSMVLANPHSGLNVAFDMKNIALNPKEAYTQEININSKHNLMYDLNFYIYYSIPKLKQSFAENYSVYLDFLYNDLYDEFTHNKIDLQLKNSLKNYVANHKSYTYKDARTYMFGSFDNIDGWVECVYTGQKIQTDGIPDVNTTHFNNEHTWPQSKGAENEPEKSDIFHMYPTYEPANSKRGDTQFGNVVSNIQWEMGGSKLGNDENGNLRFEPRNVHKGNVARSLFYFAIRYNNPYNWLNPQEKVLREWMKVDTVDKREMKRNDDIAGIQGKRNPFIDHPEFLERIYSISFDSTFPQIPSYNFTSKKIYISSFFLASNLTYNYFLTNKGNTSLTISGYKIINPDNNGIITSVKDFSNSVLLPDSSLKIELTFFENSGSNTQNSILEIDLSDGSKLEVFFDEVYYNSINEKSEPNISVYPNPVSDELTIKGLNPFFAENLYYQIFDISGNMEKEGNLASLLNQSNVDVKNLPCGFHFIQIFIYNSSYLVPFEIIR